MRRRFLILLNPDAGQDKRFYVERCVHALEERGASIRIEYGNSAAHSRAFAERARGDGSADAVIAAGGDGTVSNIARGLLGGDLPLGLIPAGTANVLAHEIGLRRAPDQVARCLTEGPTVPVYGGFANDIYFVLMAGAGIDGEIVQGIDDRLKRRWGKLAFALSVLKVLGRPRHPAFAIEADGKKAHAPWAIVTNAQFYAGSFRLTREASIIRPGLHLVTIAGATPLSLAARLAALALGRLEKQAAVTVARCKTVTLGAGAQVALQLDGDSHAMTPAVIRPSETPFRLIVPAEFKL